MQCSQCQHENREGAKFCDECGTQFVHACPHCGHELRPQAKFCDDCGTSLTTPVPETPPDTQDVQPIQADPHAPEAERRQLTVVFCDLVDSTKLSGQLDPEDYREVLRAYQVTCAEVIHRFDGYIAQHLGDALLVYFGFPVAHENDAHRGILAGLGMLEAMKPYITVWSRKRVFVSVLGWVSTRGSPSSVTWDQVRNTRG
jgi:hypothetical protein